MLKINHSYILSLKDDWDGEISTEKAVAHNAHEAEAHISMYTQTAPSVVDRSCYSHRAPTQRSFFNQQLALFKGSGSISPSLSVSVGLLCISVLLVIH